MALFFNTLITIDYSVAESPGTANFCHSCGIWTAVYNVEKVQNDLLIMLNLIVQKLEREKKKNDISL